MACTEPQCLYKGDLCLTLHELKEVLIYSIHYFTVFLLLNYQLQAHITLVIIIIIISFQTMLLI